VERVGNNADARLMIRARAGTVTRRCSSPRDPPTQLGFFFVQSTEFLRPAGIKSPPPSLPPIPLVRGTDRGALVLFFRRDNLAR